MKEPTPINECSLPQRSRSEPVPLLTQSPYTKSYLMEVSRLFHTPACRNDLIRLLSVRSTLEPFITTCANERKLGREVLGEIVLIWPGLLKQLVIHDMFLNSNPAIRISCLECLIDLLKSSVAPRTTSLKTKLTKKSLDILEDHLVDGGKKNDKVPKIDIRFRGRSVTANIIKAKKAKKPPALSPASSYTSETYSEGVSRSRKNMLQLLSHGGKGDSESQVWADGFLSSSSLSRSFRRERESIYSEDYPPDKKSSEDWFLRSTPDDVKESNKPLMSSSRTSFTDLPLETVDKEAKELEKPLIVVPSTSGSSDEAVSELTRSGLIRQEEEWFRNTAPVTVKTNVAHQSILKKTTGSLKKRYRGQRVRDSRKNAFMYKLVDFGVLVALGDLASLDPDPDPQEIAVQAIRLMLECAPDSLLPKLPKTYGYFTRNHRQLSARRPTRPKHLNRGIRSLMRKVNGDLQGRTLLVGATTGVYVQRLTTYFQCYCSQGARELIVSTYYDEIAQLRLYPGFSDIHYRLANYSTVGFDLEKEYKEYDPGENPDLLTSSQSKRVYNDANKLSVMFGVDGTKLQNDRRLKASLFDRVLWNLPTVEWSRRSITKSMLVSRFLSGAESILSPNGTVEITLPRDSVSVPTSELQVTTNVSEGGLDLESILEASAFKLVKTRNVPKSLFQSTEVDTEFLNATVYFLKLESASDSEESYSEGWFEDK